MKKFLSLVLALVMTMSLVTVSAGAKDFADNDTITYDEAVAVMSGVKVVDGYADGSFKPTNNLTRQAAAKIICNMILGPTTAAELRADTAPFKDVPVTSDFAGYIAYCAKEGIINGYADGEFKPGNPLTGYAFMKMLLGALGYESANEGYTGPNWSINVAKKALNLGLNKGLVDEFNGVKVVNREEACLYAFNTLKATMVEYDSKTVVSIGGAEVSIAAPAQDLAWGTGKLNDGNIKKDGFVQFAEKYFTKLVAKADVDAFGRPATTWVNDKKDIGSYMNYDLLAAEYTTSVEGGEIYSAIGSNAADFDLTYVVNGKELSKTETNKQAAQIAKKNDDTMAETGNGALTQVFVDNDAEELTITVIDTFLAVTDDYNEKKETLKLDVFGYDDVEALKLEEFATIENYEDGDMVLVTVANGEVQSIVDAEVVEGVEVDEFSKKDYVKAEGTQYDYAKTGKLKDESYGYELLANYDKSNLDGKTFNLYLDTNGYMVGIEQVEEDVEYVFVTGVDRPVSHLTRKTAEAFAIFADGTTATIQIDMKKSNLDGSDANWTVGDSTVNEWYTYSVKNDVYKLNYAENQFHKTAADVAEIDSKHISQKNDGLYYYGNADTNYIVAGVSELNGDVVIDSVESVTTGVKNVSIDVYTEADILDMLKKDAPKDADSQGVYTVHNTSGAYIIASIVIGDDGETTDKYAYLYGNPKNEKYSKSEDVYYWDMKAVMNGAETVVTFKTELPADDSFAEGLYKLTYEGEYAIDAAWAVHGVDYDHLDEFDPDNTDIIKSDFAGVELILTAKGDTLWITEQGIERGYALADECPAVIVEQKGSARKVVEYTSVAKAIKALDNDVEDDGFNFDGQIILFFEDGIVTSVILTDTVTETENDKPVYGGNVDFESVDVINNVIVLDERDQDGATEKSIESAAKAALASVGYKAVGHVNTAGNPWTIVAVDMESANTTSFTFDIVWG